MNRTRKERQADFLEAMNMVYDCQDDFWTEIYVATNDFGAVRAINEIFLLLESENMLDEAMDLFYVLCYGFGMSDMNFPKIYSLPSIKYPFINELILEGEEVINYLESEFEDWNEYDE